MPQSAVHMKTTSLVLVLALSMKLEIAWSEHTSTGTGTFNTGMSKAPVKGCVHFIDSELTSYPDLDPYRLILLLRLTHQISTHIDLTGIPPSLCLEF